MSRTNHLKELMRQSFDAMSLSVHDVETVKVAKKKLHELDVKIRNYVYSVSKSENQTMRNEDNDIPQHGSTQILDPVRRKLKGVTNSRMKSAIDKRKKGKKCLQPFHGVTLIKQTLMLNTDFHMNPSHQNMEMSSNMMSIQHAYAQPFSFTSLIMQESATIGWKSRRKRLLPAAGRFWGAIAKRPKSLWWGRCWPLSAAGKLSHPSLAHCSFSTP
ncbi:protein FAR1-RELATED SEQUENCE 5-like [Salvia divinorum]|uniref:Protein FAR1-RELATED SEQUENCE 5-like n=1 Tax=Salvia divinorum TaxID=28513 RepID=A0ABD1FW53_SALDI